MTNLDPRRVVLLLTAALLVVDAAGSARATSALEIGQCAPKFTAGGRSSS